MKGLTEMEYLCLNPRVMDTLEKLHEHLLDALGFSVDYGMNLDALYDEMTTLFEPVSILCLRFEKDGRPLYPHAEPFYRVLLDAARENPCLRVEVETLPAG
ncbi:MAG: barstar family protein [Clostridia bacterium]